MRAAGAPVDPAPRSTTRKPCCRASASPPPIRRPAAPRSAVTNDKGEYRLQNLPPGKYTIQAELSGFSTVMLKDVELLVGQNATMPFTMKLAQVSETLTVVGETPLVDTTSSQVAGNVDRRQMEQLPLQGRNWMELSKLVKGVTANDVGNSIGTGAMDDLWQLNLDGQQITQKVAGSGFGQPRFSREAIAEFQIVTNMFDITQGRSAGIADPGDLEVGHQRDRAAAATASSGATASTPPIRWRCKVLPYSNQQVGGTLGGPIVKDKIHYFASYEYEREPGTAFQSPSLLPGQSVSVPYQNGQKSFLARVDDQLTTIGSAVGPRIVLDLGEPVLRDQRHDSAVGVVGPDEERDQRARHVDEGDGRRQPAARDQGRLQRLPLDQRAAGVDARHAGVPHSRA